MTVSIVQSKTYLWSAGGTLTFDATCTAGHGLIAAYAHRSISPPSMTGWTQIPEAFATAFNNDACTIWYKTAAAGTETNITGLNASMAIYFCELDAGITLNVHAEAQDPHTGGGTSASPTTAGVSASNGDFCVAVCTDGTDGGWGANSYTPPAGWTERLDSTQTTDHPTAFVGTKVSSGASENCAPTCTNAGFWSAQIATFTPAGGGGSSGRSAGVINLAKRLLVPERRLWVPGLVLGREAAQDLDSVAA